jgi:hypothetical protein
MGGEGSRAGGVKFTICGCSFRLASSDCNMPGQKQHAAAIHHVGHLSLLLSCTCFWGLQLPGK